MKKSIVMGIFLLFSAHVYGFVDSITNESGLDITVRITNQDGTEHTETLVAGEKKVFNRENKCIYEIQDYEDKWKSVEDVSPDDTLVIPESWNRCQNWDFIIKRRVDGTVYVARKKGTGA